MSKWFKLGLFSIFGFVSCVYDDEVYNGILDPEIHLPVIVQKLPYGFINLNEAIYGKDYINYLFWSTNIVFLAYPGGHNILQLNVRFDDFIVLYGGAYYVHEKAIQDIIHYAKNREEYLSKTYSIGEKIKIPSLGGLGITYIIEIVALDRILEVDGKVTYNMTFNVDPNISNERVLSYAIFIETINGEKYDMFHTDVINIVDTSNVRITISSEDAISVITVFNPSVRGGFEGHERRVKVGE